MAQITDAAMLILYNEALQAIATGQSYEINGRRLTRADLRGVRDTIMWLEFRIKLAAQNNGNIVLSEFVEPT